MSEEEKESFMKSFPNSQDMFLFRYEIKHNLKSKSLKNIIAKNLYLYSSLYNSYFIQEKKSIWDIIPSYKRIIVAESMISQ
jgi:hypothetical protein